MKILTHTAPRHADETLAVLLLKDKYPDAKVITVHPQENINEYLSTSKAIVVDIGKDFNPKLKNYDHHQDFNLPCSLVQVLVHELPEALKKINHTGKGGEFLAAVDTIDRFGFRRASLDFNLRKSASCSIAQRLFLELSDKVMDEEIRIWDIPFAEVFIESLQAGDKGFSRELREAIKIVGYFIEQERDSHPYLYFFKNALSMLNEHGKKLLIETARKIRKQEEEYLKAVERAVVVGYFNKITAVVSKKTAPARMFFAKYKEADILIAPNEFSPEQTSIIKNTAKATAKKIDLRDIYGTVFSEDDELFTHQSGFITVVDKEFSEVVKRVFDICNVYVYGEPLSKVEVNKDIDLDM